MEKAAASLCWGNDVQSETSRNLHRLNFNLAACLNNSIQKLNNTGVNKKKLSISIDFISGLNMFVFNVVVFLNSPTVHLIKLCKK